MSKECGSCKFSDMMMITFNDEDMPHMFCRRYPPQVVAIHDTNSVAFPLVHEDDWCGEWQSNLLDITNDLGGE